MSATLERLKELGHVLPPAAAPVANYVPFKRAGNLVVISGQICFGPDGKLDPRHTGKVGGGISQEVAAEAARFCALNVLAQLQAAAGNLDDAVVSCIRLGGFINAAPGFSAVAAVMNGASDLMVEVLGERGRHARSTVGVAELPLDAVVEVEGMFEVR
ncbi:RidA family protein [Methylobacterium oryzihabitans]|uniref:RidA family protein n=1 Tax=Methylobacterium oryzihabitans TaxID=2499852 RepID=A0A437P700_9HYPH|nr:RidA family protein [Methylobacterium oryzihabitans]RVU18043.1 RidA family protein [Methylobacterium oryzihabitans]